MPIPTHIRRKFKNSSNFQVTNTTEILSGAKFYFELDPRFIPYDEALIINLNRNNDCTIEINNREPFPLPKGNELKIENESIRILSVFNDGATTISVNQIKVTYVNTGHQGKKIIHNFRVGAEILANIRLIRGFFR